MNSLPVSLQTLPDTRVAYLRQTGPYGPTVAGLWQRFMIWCGNQGLLSPRRPALYGISLDNPEFTAPDTCRYNACIAVADAFVPSGEIRVQTIPGGRYACAEFKGNASEVSAAWQWLCGAWIAGSGYQFDDRPVFELYPPDGEQNAATQTFHCLLCIPVRPL